MVGAHYNNFTFIFGLAMCSHIEVIWKERTSMCDNILVCKEFKIEKTQRGGLNEIFETM